MLPLLELRRPWCPAGLVHIPNAHPRAVEVDDREAERVPRLPVGAVDTAVLELHPVRSLRELLDQVFRDAAMADAAREPHALVAPVGEAAMLVAPEPRVQGCLGEHRPDLLAKPPSAGLVWAEELVVAEQDGLAARCLGAPAVHPVGLVSV